MKTIQKEAFGEFLPGVCIGESVFRSYRIVEHNLLATATEIVVPIHSEALFFFESSRLCKISYDKGDGYILDNICKRYSAYIAEGVTAIKIEALEGGIGNVEYRLQK